MSFRNDETLLEFSPLSLPRHLLISYFRKPAASSSLPPPSLSLSEIGIGDSFRTIVSIASRNYRSFGEKRIRDVRINERAKFLIIKM